MRQPSRLCKPGFRDDREGRPYAKHMHLCLTWRSKLLFRRKILPLSPE